jgi:hypothetical protein
MVYTFEDVLSIDNETECKMLFFLLLLRGGLPPVFFYTDSYVEGESVLSSYIHTYDSFSSVGPSLHRFRCAGNEHAEA